MDADRRTYIEIRYDGEAADVVIAAFRERWPLPVECHSTELVFATGEVSEDPLAAVKDLLPQIIENL